MVMMMMTMVMMMMIDAVRFYGRHIGLFFAFCHFQFRSFVFNFACQVYDRDLMAPKYSPVSLNNQGLHHGWHQDTAGKAGGGFLRLGDILKEMSNIFRSIKTNFLFIFPFVKCFPKIWWRRRRTQIDEFIFPICKL